MRKFISALACLFIASMLQAQKKPLDHSVYDGWQSVQQTLISNDGKWVVYMINPQEGDGELVIQSTDGAYKKTIARGYSHLITDDSRFVIFKIRPLFKDTRDARIKKKRPDDMPKDSLAMMELGKDSVWKVPRVKSFKTPEKASGWIAYHLEKSLPQPPAPAPKPDSLTQINKMVAMADSLMHIADSLKNKAIEAKTKGLNVLQPSKKETKPAAPKPADDPVEEGTDFVIRNMITGEEKKFKLVSDYYFSKKGNALLIETTKKNNDTLSKALVLWMNTAAGKIDTVLKGFNDAKNYAMDEEGSQLAFVAERDSVSKALKKFYKLWYYKPGMSEAKLKVDRTTAGVKDGMTVSPDYTNKFSKNGQRLFVGLAPIRQPKDTTLADFETARLDIWNYKDDELQPQQLVQLNNELRRSYLGVINNNADAVTPLADENLERISLTDEDNADVAMGETNKSYRIQNQWEQFGYTDVYLVNTNTGERKLVASKLRGGADISAKGKFILWYDWKQRHYFTYEMATGKTINATKDIKVPLWDEEDDHPDDPPPHGFMSWLKNDAFMYIYDKYDIWKVDPTGVSKPVCITNGTGRKNEITFRYIQTDREERFVKEARPLLLTIFDNKEKGNGLKLYKPGENFVFDAAMKQTYPLTMQSFFKAKNSPVFGYLKGSFNRSYNVAVVTSIDTAAVNDTNGKTTKYEIKGATQLSDINQQQKNYNWFTVELHKWKMFDGKMSEGLLFKPENFDSTKKYPVVFYFYERDADTRYNYRSPAPSASTVNIPWFTSNGYLVFDPNIYYKNGEPGESAYNAVVSAAKYLSKFKFVDSTKMAIQGQSWGGYQVAYLITRTKMFAAAGAGAPVSNMLSAYGGIRWGTGISRQFQYEKSQSRLGFTPWQRPDLYTKNSPLFKADKVVTPLLIMHNDKDGAVPWYQGIEYFTALKRLGKTVYLLQYNDEDHNLVERRNRKDLSVRLGQFFDHYLKGAPMPVWMKSGVPATGKGIDWGLKIE
ncbi:MAG: prolyl oligopeptidase family serine peptidase [Chitinophagaceae bacterium]|nr:prolyl oligopeptidase family serine peptidase [Chitinophagaceae bacterium]